MNSEDDVLNGLRDDVQALSAKIDQLESRTAHRIWAITAAVVVMVLVLAGIVGVGFYSYRQAGCVRDYAIQAAARTNAVAPKLDALVRTIAPDPRKTQAERGEAFQAALVQYLKASDENPVPASPDFRC